MDRSSEQYNDRDLLVLLNERMNQTLNSLATNGERIRHLELKVRELETRMNIYVAVAASLGGLIGSIITKLF
jgi:hypothetical protein